MPEIAVLGNFVVDIIGKPLDRLPERGRLSLIDTLETHVGGNGPNTAGALGKLGADVAVLGCVGRDLYGDFLLERLRGWGVEISAVARLAETSTGVSIVAVDGTGERSFIYYPGANAAFGPENIPWERLEVVRHLHFGSFFVLPRMDGPAAASVLAEARRRGMTTSLDLCWDREGHWMEALAPALPHVDFCLPSEEEAAQLTDETKPARMAASLRERGCRAAVVKLGERGCYYSGPAGELHVPAFDVPVRETTGAGDCFIAGFLYAQLRGWELQRQLRFANACGARSVQAVGAVTGILSSPEVESWSSTQPSRDDRNKGAGRRR